MKSNKPYLLRAFFDWIVDNQCTPLVTLDANIPNVIVPVEYIENGEITLNIAPEAIKDLKITNTHIDFNASFSGVIHYITAPIRAIKALYAHENGEGIFFDDENEEDDSWETETVSPAAMTKAGASHLRVIK